MKFRMEVQLDNAAYDPDTWELELAANLRDVASKVWDHNSGKIRDSNGNTVGEWKITRG